MTTTQNQHQSKWGYHVCDRETFQMLKELKKEFHVTQHKFYNWWRWQRKQEQNRKGPEPAYNSVFVYDEPWTLKTKRTATTDRGQKYEYTHFRFFPKRLDDRGVLDLFEDARTPHKEPVEPWSEAVVKRIKDLYDDMRVDRDQ